MITDTDPDLVDALLATLAAVVVAGLLFVVWVWSAGRYAPDPYVVVPATSSDPVIAHLEEGP